MSGARVKEIFCGGIFFREIRKLVQEHSMQRRVIGFLDQFIEKGSILGRVVANEGFLFALFSYDPADEYRFYPYDPVMFRENIAKLDMPAIRRGAVKVFARQNLLHDIRTEDFFCFHLNDPLSMQTKLAVLRNRYAKTLFPITSIPHSINYTAYASDFLNEIWPGATPRDVICATSQAAVFVLEEYFRELHENYHLPAAWRGPSLRFLPLGVDTTFLQPPTPQARAQAREKYGIEDDEILCLAHGRITVDDKMDLLPLLYAVKRVLEGEHPPRLHILVSGHVREKDTYPDVLRTMARNAGIPFDMVVSPAREEVTGLYAASDIFLSPSDNIQETFGITLLEAGAMGLPAIVSDWNGYKDLVLDGETGFRIPTVSAASTTNLDIFAHILPDNIHDLFRAQQTIVDVPKLAEAIGTLARSEQLRKTLGDRARKHIAATYDWKHIIQKWITLVEELREIPFSEQEERTYRTAKHPAMLNIAKIFGHHPSKNISEEDLLKQVICLSRRGKNVLGKKDVSVCWPNLTTYMKDVDIRKILVFARKKCTVAEIKERLASDGIEDERFQFIILWMIKHDLLEYSV